MEKHFFLNYELLLLTLTLLLVLDPDRFKSFVLMLILFGFCNNDGLNFLNRLILDCFLESVIPNELLLLFLTSFDFMHRNLFSLTLFANINNFLTIHRLIFKQIIYNISLYLYFVIRMSGDLFKRFIFFD